MSEVLPRGHEKGEQNHVDSEKSKERARELSAERDKSAAKAEADGAKAENSIEAIHERVEKAARKSEALSITRGEKAASDSSIPIGSKQFGDHTAKRTLQRVRKQLPAKDRALSKVIHQPAIEVVSNAAGATVARPSGLLVGGIFSLISSIVVLYISRHYGYEYNFMIALASFAGGFALGLLLEGASKLFRRR